MMKAIVTGVVLAASAVTALPAQAATVEDFYTRTSAGESLTAQFANPAGATSAQTYTGFVEVNVGGTGQSDGTFFNDAFYEYAGGRPLGNFYQLGLGTAAKPYTPGSDASYAAQYVVFVDGPGGVARGTRPAYDPTHAYRFVVDLGAVAPTLLTFGVTDGVFTDNSGAFNLRIYQLGAADATSAPEPASWAMLLLGFGGVGYALRRRQTVRTRIRFV